MEGVVSNDDTQQERSMKVGQGVRARMCIDPYAPAYCSYADVTSTPYVDVNYLRLSLLPLSPARYIGA